MKVFLSWSGDRSQKMAAALAEWLPMTINAIELLFSPNIKKGADWANELAKHLESTSFGIVCLTQENLKSEWVHYEVGALSKTKDALVWTVLLDLMPGEVRPPLGRLMHTTLEKDDFFKFLEAVNDQIAAVGERSLNPLLLTKVFERDWPALEAKLRAIEPPEDSPKESTSPAAQPIESNQEMFGEILEILRSQQRDSHSLEPKKPPHECFNSGIRDSYL